MNNCRNVIEIVFRLYKSENLQRLKGNWIFLFFFLFFTMNCFRRYVWKMILQVTKLENLERENYRKIYRVKEK